MWACSHGDEAEVWIVPGEGSAVGEGRELFTMGLKTVEPAGGSLRVGGVDGGEDPAEVALGAAWELCALSQVACVVTRRLWPRGGCGWRRGRYSSGVTKPLSQFEFDDLSRTQQPSFRVKAEIAESQFLGG